MEDYIVKVLMSLRVALIVICWHVRFDFMKEKEEKP